MDPTGHDALLRWLAYGHPAWMVLALATVGLTLRAGLGLRRARRLHLPRTAESIRRHTRLGRVAVALVVVGFVGGPLSMWWLRGRMPYGTVHAYLATSAAALFVTVAILGLRLERSRGRNRARSAVETHGWLALLACLAAAVSFVTGLVLLP
ncbi:MAG: DUF4079 family protein [Myxococcota bacterium]